MSGGVEPLERQVILMITPVHFFFEFPAAFLSACNPPGMPGTRGHGTGYLKGNGVPVHPAPVTPVYLRDVPPVVIRGAAAAAPAAARVPWPHPGRSFSSPGGHSRAIHRRLMPGEPDARSGSAIRFFGRPETALRYLDLKEHAPPVLPAFPDRKPGDREDLPGQE